MVREIFFKNLNYYKASDKKLILDNYLICVGCNRDLSPLTSINKLIGTTKEVVSRKL